MILIAVNFDIFLATVTETLSKQHISNWSDLFKPNRHFTAKRILPSPNGGHEKSIFSAMSGNMAQNICPCDDVKNKIVIFWEHTYYPWPSFKNTLIKSLLVVCCVNFSNHKHQGLLLQASFIAIRNCKSALLKLSDAGHRYIHSFIRQGVTFIL